ncbi:glutamate receptor ionotropic, delta-2-like [Lineus longissimus]|uniref:glutamate receptor ionotropic, delta-2-like n=1 Tax=Lineus longissimus TaxID=88925 RepID=UPI002B4F8E2D
MLGHLRPAFVVLSFAFWYERLPSANSEEISIGVRVQDAKNFYLADALTNMKGNIKINVVDLSVNMSYGVTDFRLLYRVCDAILNNGISLVISDVACDDVPRAAQALQSFPVAHLFIVTSPCRPYDVTAKNALFYRPVYSWTKIVLEIIKRENWNHLNIFYDVTTGKENVDFIIDTIYKQESSTSMTIIDVTDLTEETLHFDLGPLLFSLKTDIAFGYFEVGQHLLLCTMEKAGLILKAFADYEMRNMIQKWLVYHPKWPNRCESFLFLNLTLTDNMAIIRHVSSDTRITEQTVKEELSNTLMVSFGEMFTSPLSDIMLKNISKCTDSANAEFTNALQRVLEANRPYFGINPNITQFRIDSHVGVGQIKEVATWDAERKLQFHDKLFPKTQWGFQGRKFVVSSLEYSYFQQKRNISGKMTWVGLTFEILNELARVLNFTYEVTEPPDLFWGIKQTDGQWNGMIREVLDEKVDFAAACFSVTADRQHVTDMASPYYSEQTVIIFRKQDSAGPPLYIRPYSYTVWFCLIGCVVGSGLFLTFLAIISPYEGVYPARLPTQTTFQYYRFVLITCMLYAYGCVVQQGGNRVAETQSMRCFAAFQWIMAVVMISTYTGNLIAFLAVKQVDMPFNTIAEMVQQNKLPWGTVDGVALNMLFRESNISDYKKVWAAIEANPSQNLVKSYDDARKKLQTEEWALIAEKSWYQQEQINDCDLIMAKEEFFPTSYAWSLPKGSSYLQIFNEAINKIREAGLLEFWIKKWTPQNLVCKGLDKQTVAKAAPLKEVQSAFILLGFLLCFCLFIFLLECMWKHRPGRRRPKAPHGVQPNGNLFTLSAPPGGSSTLKLTEMQKTPS